MGRPKIEITDDICGQAYELASTGLTKKEIAISLGFSIETLKRREKDLVLFADSIKKGRIEAIRVMTNALFNAGINGNITAMIFYLKNRAPNEWKDRVPEGTQSDQAATQRVEVTIKGATIADTDTTTS